MKHLHFEPEADGFYGAYWESKTPSDTAMIAMLGDDPEDYMGKTCVKWLHTYGINVMSMSPGKKNYSHHNYPLERIGSPLQRRQTPRLLPVQNATRKSALSVPPHQPQSHLSPHLIITILRLP